MKEYIKLFNDLQSADGYIIADIPFITTAIDGMNLKNVRCSVAGKKIKVINNMLTLCDAPTPTLFTLVNGIEIEIYDDTVLPEICSLLKDYIVEVELSSNITEIKNETFKDCINLSSITIPDSVTSIGYQAFYNCTSLPVENNIRYAGDYLVEVADKTLNTYTIKTGTKIIGSGAFKNCTNVTSIAIPDGVTIIEDQAFCDPENMDLMTFSYGGGCSSLTGITIPDSVTSLGMFAFSDCTNLSSVTIGSGVTYLATQLFARCSSLSSVTVNGNITGCDDLSDLRTNTALPVDEYGLIYIGDILISAHDRTRTSYTIKPDTKIIGGTAFFNCKNLSAITIPDSVTSIGDAAFSDCSGLTSVTIGSGVTSIGNSAFYGCNNITSFVAPDNIKFPSDIMNSIFALDTYTESGGNWKFPSDGGLMYSNNGNYLLVCDSTNKSTYNVKPGTKHILPYAFTGFHMNFSVTIPDSVTIIDTKAFNGYVSSVTLGSGVTTIGNDALSYCKFTSVTIPNSVTSIGEDAFNGNGVLSSITVDPSNTHYDSRNNCNAIIETSSNTLITGCKNTVIPSSVTSIGNGAFMNCTGLTSIVIPDSVTSIGEQAFYHCSGLTSVTIPDSVTSIGNRAFEGCSGLTSVTIPNSVTSIGEDAFAGCSGLTSVTIPNSVTSVGSSAFYNCRGLTSITIPIGVTSIGDAAFSDCSGLTSITIPDSVTSIGSYAFSNCTSLTSIIIPNSVVVIGESAFSYCSGLTNIKCESTIPPILNEYVFDEIPKSIPVYVQSTSISTYQTATGWSEFTNYQPIPTV